MLDNQPGVYYSCTYELTRKEGFMTGTLESARQKLQDGKSIFNRAGNNQSMLKEALMCISAALDDYIDASPPSTRTASSGYRMQAARENAGPLSKKLDQLRDDRII